MRSIQKLSPRKFKNVDDALKSVITFDKKFNKLNTRQKLKYESVILIGDETELEIEIYEV